MSEPPPIISIGVPVYNGGATLRAALESLLAQSFSNFEVVISDNASTDGTAAICEEFTARDSRIRYIRQAVNIGGEANFKFVLDEATAPYFLWAAADDVRTEDFLAENIAFLEKNPDYVGSSSPNCFEGQDPSGKDLVTFAIDASTPEQRFIQFFQNCWRSHCIFYSVMRTRIIQECGVVGRSFVASDWVIDLYMVKNGPIHRTSAGLTTLGVSGISRQDNPFKTLRKHPVEILLPFFWLSKHTLALSNEFPYGARVEIGLKLLKLNKKILFSTIRKKWRNSKKRRE